MQGYYCAAGCAYPFSAHACEVVTATPTAAPTDAPTAGPTKAPTAAPTGSPTAFPSAFPTYYPTGAPTTAPTATSVPTAAPSASPTPVPTGEPTSLPTGTPTASPTAAPTAVPTFVPTPVPSPIPTLKPTGAPTAAPTTHPTAHPCDDGSHGCDKGAGGICYQYPGASQQYVSGNAYYCDCAEGYICIYGCDAPHTNHACALSAAPTHAPTLDPTKEPVNPGPPPPPTPNDAQPLLRIHGSDELVIEASRRANYQDQGATCQDPVLDALVDISARVAVRGVLFPVLHQPGVYSLTYSCGNYDDRAAEEISRAVVVRDTTCPTCTMNFKQVVTIEASFPYVDAGATCSDSVSGVIDDVVVQNLVDVEQDGEYLVTYRARDAAGNWNDGSCRGSQRYIRTVQVIDTLQPVISLRDEMRKGDLEGDLGEGDGGDSNLREGDGRDSQRDLKKRFGRRLAGQTLFRTAGRTQPLWFSTSGLAIVGGLCASLLLLHIFAERGVRWRKAQQQFIEC